MEYSTIVFLVLEILRNDFDLLFSILCICFSVFEHRDDKFSNLCPERNSCWQWIGCFSIYTFQMTPSEGIEINELLFHRSEANKQTTLRLYIAIDILNNYITYFDCRNWIPLRNWFNLSPLKGERSSDIYGMHLYVYFKTYGNPCGNQYMIVWFYG